MHRDKTSAKYPRLSAFIRGLLFVVLGLRDRKRQVVQHLGLIARNFVIGGAQQLILAIDQRFSNVLLDAGIRQLPLAGRFLGIDLEHPVAFRGADCVGNLAGRRCLDRLAELRIDLLQRGLGYETQVASVGRRLWILRKILGELSVVFTLLQARYQHVDFLTSLFFIMCLVTLEIPDVRIWIWGDKNLSQVNLRLWKIEAALVGVIEIGDVAIRN